MATYNKTGKKAKLLLSKIGVKYSPAKSKTKLAKQFMKKHLSLARQGTVASQYELGKAYKSGKKTKTKKRRKRKIKGTDEQKEIWVSIKGGATVSELAAEQGCSDTNIRQQYAKAKAKLKKLNTGSKSVNFRTIGQIPKDRRGQEALEDKRKTT